MIRARHSLSALAIALVLAGCGPEGGSETPVVAPTPTVTAPPRAAEAPPPVRVTPDAPFRDKAPAPEGTVTFVPPKIESFKLKNGLRVLFVERRELPVVSVRVAVKGGAGDYADLKPGVASFMGAMLEQGAGKRSALQLSDDYEALGAQHGAGVDVDSGYVALKVLSQHLDAALAIFGEVVQSPTFPEEEITRLRERRLGALVADKKSPGAMAANAVSATVFGRQHPYGHSTTGREEDVKAIKRDALVKAYKEIFSPKNATIIVAGDVAKADLEAKLEKAFGGWKAAGGPAPKAPTTPKENEKAARLVLVDFPGATQSQVLLAQPGVAFSTPDRDAISVMNAILGGTFGSRINMNLREKNGYTYGARSRFGIHRGAGSFTAGGAMKTEATVPAVRELFTELAAIRDRDVTAEELSAAKEQIKLTMPARFETVSDVTAALEDLAVYDLPLDDFAKRVARVEAVTAADVKRVARSILHPKTMKVVIVGDRAKISGELESLNLGAPDVRDPYGDPLK